MTRFINISDYIKTKFNNEAGRRAASVAEEILKKTGHLPVVTTIARGVGFCTFHARLTEAIGAQSLEGHTIDRACGKGDDVHKILGLSSLKFFSGEKAEIKEIIKEVTEELRRLSIIQNEARLEESKIEAEKLMRNLLQKIGLFEEITGMKVSDAVPIVEQQLVDYELRMRGFPI
jgi:Asp-tRNA(Asn)/Glu-tRNA(Gln) amidotransferase C subunit